MNGVYIGLGILLAVGVLVLGAAYLCFHLAFFVPRRHTSSDEIELPKGKIYEPYYDSMTVWARQTREMPYEEMCITSFDGLRLYGKYYEYASDAPIELMFHGYRSSAQRDLCGAVQRCRELGHSALIVDQRCSGRSEGRVITFGVREHRDCLSWRAVRSGGKNHSHGHFYGRRHGADDGG